VASILSQQVDCWRGERCGGSLSKQEGATLLALTATLFCYYDSLIEKCSTLSAVRALARVDTALSHLSLAGEWNELVERTITELVSDTLEPFKQRGTRRVGGDSLWLPVAGPLHPDSCLDL
jgi:hypothetical protein